tara:strand:- start:166 stop:765 length:600 start_codon:yes stop_codon:yes gene_type:complete
MHPSGFNEVYKERTVNSIYFDSFNYDLYNQSINGDLKRKKIRIRWYENESKIFSFLEIKQKEGEKGFKSRYDLLPIISDQNISREFLKNLLYKSNIKNKDLLITFDKYSPKLICSYKRKYFISSNQKIRLTIDYKISYSNFFYESSISSINKIYDSKIVIEYKYDYFLASEFFISENILNLRRTRFSKYSNGIEILYGR